MKTLVLKSLLLTALVSQTTGCIISSGSGEEDAFITAEWSFKQLATDELTGCPPNVDTVSLIAQPLDLNLNPIGQPYIDAFDCTDGRHTSAPLPPDIYQVWLQAEDTSAGTIYAQSTAATIDLIDQDATFAATILHDGGYFALSWELEAASDGTPLACAEVPGLDGVEAISTSVVDPNYAAVDKFRCEDHYGITGGLLAGTYTVSVDAFDDGVGGGALGAPVTITNAVIADRNRITDLGTVILPIDGF